jgi:hypothetical protein
MRLRPADGPSLCAQSANARMRKLAGHSNIASLLLRPWSALPLRSQPLHAQAQ